MTSSRFDAIVSKGGFAIIGIVFMLFSLHQLLEAGGGAYSYFGILVGAMLVFTQADRNVYYNRLGSLLSELDGLENVSVKRVEYEEYEVCVEDDK